MSRQYREMQAAWLGFGMMIAANRLAWIKRHQIGMLLLAIQKKQDFVFS